MLPGPDGMGVADTDRFSRQDGPDDIRNQPVAGPVAAADDVAGPGRGQADTVLGIVAAD